MELQDKAVIISGASSGIGAAAARAFASEGANVVLGARRSAGLEAICDAINADGRKAVFLPGDVEDPAFADALVDLAVSAFGRLDGAFNNVGIVGEMTAVTDMSLEDWNSVLSVNLTSAFLAAKAQIPVMKSQGGDQSSLPLPLSASATAACRGWEPAPPPRPA